MVVFLYVKLKNIFVCDTGLNSLESTNTITLGQLHVT